MPSARTVFVTIASAITTSGFVMVMVLALAIINKNPLLALLYTPCAGGTMFLAIGGLAFGLAHVVFEPLRKQANLRKENPALVGAPRGKPKDDDLP